MRLQDLRDDLAEAFPATIREGNPPALWRIVELARRVASLFQTCPDCGGGGVILGKCDAPPGFETFDNTELLTCSSCGGTGVVASEKMLADAHKPDAKAITFVMLAGFLFCDGPKGGEK